MHVSQVNEARDAFDVLDNDDGLLAFENVGKVLDQLGFQDEVSELTATSNRLKSTILYLYVFVVHTFHGHGAHCRALRSRRNVFVFFTLWSDGVIRVQKWNMSVGSFGG